MFKLIASFYRFFLLCFAFAFSFSFFSPFFFCFLNLATHQEEQDFNRHEEEAWGLIPRAGRYIFDEIYEQEKITNGQVKFEVKVTYLELYNERLFDLFKDNDYIDKNTGETIRRSAQSGLEIRQDKFRGVFVPGAISTVVTSEHELLGLLWEGAKNRAISATDMNEHSSRSHTILQIQITRRPISDAVLPKYAMIKKAKLNIIDLAGSETMKRNKISKFTNQRIAELTSINQSLSCLGNCIRALEKGNAHVPYRDSKLTRLLEDSLGGNTKTTFIVTVSFQYFFLKFFSRCSELSIYNNTNVTMHLFLFCSYPRLNYPVVKR